MEATDLLAYVTTRTAERLQALEYILSDGLSYSWFRVRNYNEEDCTATVYVATGDYDENDKEVFEKFEVGPDDVARGLRMYREYLEGKREAFPGEWKYAIDSLLRKGVISDASEFEPTIHARAHEESYGWQMVLFDRTNGEDGDYDATTADSVMQLATIGEIRYG